MNSVTLPAWRAEASAAQRAYLAQSAVLHGLLDTGGVLGWNTLDELRAFHNRLEHQWPTLKWPVVCGPRGAEVSRFVAQLNELRMAPQDLHVLAYSHELAHALAPHASHQRAWAQLQLDVLDIMMGVTPLQHTNELAAVRIRLSRAYREMEVI